MKVMVNGLIVEVNDFDMQLANVMVQQYINSIRNAAEDSGNRAMYVTMLLSMYLNITRMIKNLSNEDMIKVMERAKGLVAVEDIKALKIESE